MKRSSVDVVFGVQAGARRGGILERTTGDLFYRLFNVLSTIQIPRNILTIRLMTRPYVNALTSLGDREMYMAGLMSFAGFRQLSVPIDNALKGTSSYSIPRRVVLQVNAVTSFLNKPLWWIMYLGTGVLILSGIAIGLLLLRKALGGTLEGWASVMVPVWIFGGLILFCLGIVGIYLGKVHAEVKRRPLTMVRRVHHADGLENHTDA
jgi:putative glycosyltransferase